MVISHVLALPFTRTLSGDFSVRLEALPMIKQIMPWKCHTCEREFDTLGGGICKNADGSTKRVGFEEQCFRAAAQFKVRCEKWRKAASSDADKPHT